MNCCICDHPLRYWQSIINVGGQPAHACCRAAAAVEQDHWSEDFELEARRHTDRLREGQGEREGYHVKNRR